MNGTEHQDTATAEARVDQKQPGKVTKPAQMIAKYGLTIRAYVIALLIFPPVAPVIAWRIPRLPMAARIPMVLLGFIVPVITVTTLGGVLFKFL